ncbi:MAG TPA: ornithine--oxo-acid transaminase [Candidatus Eisenbacteria bacterium]|nr:ornithine--oxo-acid transaminase [Candidatus Eisenbacteria bacterium]
MKTNDFIQLEDTYLAHNYHPLDVVISRGKGVWVWDSEGKKYLDCLGGYSALSHGHVHKKILAAAVSQMKRLTLTGRAFRNDQLGLLSKEICQAFGYDMFLPMNSGAEAVETALKVARKWGYEKKKVENGKAEIVAVSNNFHGRTITIISFSTEKQYQEGFTPLTAGFRIVPFDNIDALKKAITKNTVAILLEPIQAEGGIIVPKNGYLTKVAQLCRDNNVLFLADEIQTGLGRTGKLFAYEYDENAKPDILILGKALGGGFYPVSGILTKKSVMEVIRWGDHGSTFGGNPLAAAIARASLKVLIEEKLVENSQKMGQYFMEKLKTIHSPWIKDIRGKGLLIGVELTENSGGARKFCELLAKEGVLCKETHDFVIRFAPALLITKKEIDWAMSKIKKVLERSDI